MRLVKIIPRPSCRVYVVLAKEGDGEGLVNTNEYVKIITAEELSALRGFEANFHAVVTTGSFNSIPQKFRDMADNNSRDYGAFAVVADKLHLNLDRWNGTQPPPPSDAPDKSSYLKIAANYIEQEFRLRADDYVAELNRIYEEIGVLLDVPYGNGFSKFFMVKVLWNKIVREKRKLDRLKLYLIVAAAGIEGYQGAADLPTLHARVPHIIRLASDRCGLTTLKPELVEAAIEQLLARDDWQELTKIWKNDERKISVPSPSMESGVPPTPDKQSSGGRQKGVTKAIKEILDYPNKPLPARLRGRVPEILGILKNEHGIIIDNVRLSMIVNRLRAKQNKGAAAGKSEIESSTGVNPMSAMTRVEELATELLRLRNTPDVARFIELLNVFAEPFAALELIRNRVKKFDQVTEKLDI